MDIPKELFEIKFTRAKAFGYKTEDVDRYVAEVSDALHMLDEENEALQEKMETLAATLESYREEEDSLKSALIGAQRLADSILKDARAKADKLLQETQEKSEKKLIDAQTSADAVLAQASQKADAMLEDAAQKYDAIIGDIDRRLDSQKKLLEETKLETASFKSSLIELYKDHLDRVLDIPVDIDDLPPDRTASAPTPAPEPDPEPDPDPDPAPVPAPTPSAEPLPEPQPALQPDSEPDAAEDFFPKLDLDALLRGEGIDIGFVERQDGQVGFDLPAETETVKPEPPKQKKKSRFAEMKFGENYNIFKD